MTALVHVHGDIGATGLKAMLYNIFYVPVVTAGLRYMGPIIVQ